MILWKKDSDLYFTVALKDENMIPINPTDKSFIFRFYTTNINAAKFASYDILTNTFTNCKLNNDDPNKIDIFIDDPNFNVGRLMVDICIRTLNDSYEDGYYDVWMEVKSDIQIIK